MKTQKPSICLAIRIGSFRDESDIDFEFVKNAFLKSGNVTWQIKQFVEGFIFKDDPEVFFIVYPERGGVAVHYYGSVRVLDLCKQIAGEMGANVIVV